LGSSGGVETGIGIDHFTGKIKVKIPLGSAEDVFTSLSLFYLSGGFKPNTPSGSLGMGWNLQCGGAITRQVKGIPDEVSKYWVNEVHEDLPKNYVTPFNNQDRINRFDPANPHYVLGSSPSQEWEPNETRYLEKLANNKYDTEKDIFTIQAPGLQTSFYLDSPEQGANPTIVPIGNFGHTIVPYWKMGPLETFGTSEQIVRLDSISVFCLDGSVYHFALPVRMGNETDIKRSITFLKNSGGSEVEEATSPYSTTTEISDFVTVSWLLTKVSISPGNEVHFHYLKSSYKSRSFLRSLLDNLAFRTISQASFRGRIPKKVETTYTINSLYEHYYVPSSIITKNSRVDFSYTTELGNSQGPGVVLSAISRHVNGSIVERHLFNYRSLSSSGGFLEGNYASFTYLASRLVLSGIETLDRFNSSPGRFELDYWSGGSGKGFPHFDDLWIDYWGYFNGRAISSGASYFNEGSRNLESMPEPAVARVGLLKSNSIPNGDSWNIDYEANRSYENLVSSSYMSSISGGLRVKTLTHQTPGRSPKNTSFWYGRKNFEVSDDAQNECWKGGEPFYSQLNEMVGSENHTIAFSKRSISGFVNAGYLWPEQVKALYLYPFLTTYNLINSMPVYRMEDDMGRSVVYTRVKEIISDGSYSILEFSSPALNSSYSPLITTGLSLTFNDDPDNYCQNCDERAICAWKQHI